MLYSPVVYFDLANVLVFAGLAVVFLFGTLLVGRIVRRHRPDSAKSATYECGVESVGGSWIQFNVRFYVIALIFLIFEVEIALLFPWVTVFRRAPLLALAEIFIFVGVLVVGFAYVWAKGDLQWLKSLGEVPKDEP